MVGSVLRVRYELTQFLHEDGVLSTYSAFDKVQSREVSVRVLKEPFSADPELVENLQVIVKRLAAVRNANIEALTEVDSDDGATFIVGQLTKGSSLSERLKKLATFSTPAAVEVGIAISEGLQALHRASFSHGMLGGHSVAMQADGEVRLQDSGLWVGLFSNPQARDVLIAGNAAYNAPEISKGGLPTPSSDIYSLGVLLFELVTGHLPFLGETALALALHHATEPTPSAKVANPSVPQALDQIIKKAMAKAPSERYGDGGEILSDLRMLQDALRFGKSLNSPVGAVEEPVTPTTKTTAADTAPKTLPKQHERRQKIQNDQDVPRWLLALFVLVLGGVIASLVLFLATNLNKREKVKVPPLASQSFTEASKVMDKLGLHLLKLRTVPSETIRADTILSTIPQQGATVFQGDDVRAVVSSGSRFVAVPDLRGMTIDKAKAVLESVGLDLDENVDQTPDRDLAVGMVVSQSQDSGSKYQRGTRIHVAVSSGQDANSSDDSEANSKYVYTVKFSDAKISKPVRLRVNLTDTRGSKTVYDRQYKPGDKLVITAEGYGSSVTFAVMYDGQLVKQLHERADQLPQTGDNSDSNQSSDNQ